MTFSRIEEMENHGVAKQDMECDQASVEGPIGCHNYSSSEDEPEDTADLAFSDDPPEQELVDLTEEPDSPEHTPTNAPSEIIDLVSSTSESEDSEDPDSDESDDNTNTPRRLTYAERMLKQLEDTPQWSNRQPRIRMRL
jgi:hypothetical protein